MNSERYSRQVMLPEIGEEGQKRLQEAAVLVVGLGGLGAAVATYLTGAGVGRIGLADHDTVSLSNLQRQVLYTVDSIGKPKTAEAAARLSAQSPDTTFELFPKGLTAENARETVAGFDLVVDCTDNFAARYLIDETCAALGKPWIHGAIGEFGGQVAVMNLDGKHRYTDLYPDRESLCALPRATAGVVGATAGTVGAIEASEAIKLICGYGTVLDGRLFHIDLKTMQTDIISF